MAELIIQDEDKVFGNLAGKIILITGAAGGIGRDAVKLFHKNGAKVVVGDVQDDLGKSLEEECQGVLYQHCDVTSWTEQRDLFDAAIAKHGKIDIVCANAGILPKEDTFDWTYDSNGKLEAPVKVSKILDVNLLGHIYTTRLAAHSFEKYPSHDACIVLTGSIASYLGPQAISVYAASKHGVLGLMRSLRRQMPSKIRISMIAPWTTNTPLIAKIKDNWKGLPMNEPFDIAKAIAYAAADTNFTGKTIYVSGGKFTEIEESIASSMPIWLGKENAHWQAENAKRAAFA